VATLLLAAKISRKQGDFEAAIGLLTQAERELKGYVECSHPVCVPSAQAGEN
jgi:hypothetical protein